MNIPSSPSKANGFLSTSSGSSVLISSGSHKFFDFPNQKALMSYAVSDEFAQYELFFDLINDSVIIFDPFDDLSILKTNEKTCQYYQIAEADLLNSSYKTLWNNIGQQQDFIETLLRNGKVRDFKASHLRADKTVVDVSINASFIQFKQKRAVIAICQNVVGKMAMEQAVVRARQEWTDTVDAVSDLIILEDSEGNLRRCNKATTDFFGASFLELIGKPIASILWKNEDFVDSLNQANTTNFRSNNHLRDTSWEGKLVGSDCWYEITNHALFNNITGKTSWVHIVKDITERKSSEAELQRLYTAIEQAADSVIITDLDGDIQYVNASFEKTVGWNRTESVGRKISQIKAGLDKDENTEEIFSALLKGEAWQKTYKAKRRNGEIFDEQATISLVRDAEGNPFNCVFVCRDVTETRRLQSIAEAVNMMDNVGYIFSGIRHELGNPINSVKTALAVLKQNLGKWNSDQIDLYIERCLTETARVEYLLRTLKTFSMHENPQMQTVSLKDYMEKFVSLINGDFEQRNIQITLSVNENVGEVLCDPRALHQVMLNLLTNSADSFDGEREAKIKISLVREKKRIYVTVIDNGSGMSESQMNNLFKPFYTSKTEGNGLGLVIVRSMLGKMNGTISIQSTQNVGTRVTFTLEAANAEV